VAKPSTKNVSSGLKKEHDRQEHQQDQAVEDRPSNPPVKKLAYLVELAHVPGDLADRRALEEINGKLDDLVENVRRQLGVDALGDMQHEIAPQYPNAVSKQIKTSIVNEITASVSRASK